jgi:hypothetical protein
MSDVLRIEKAMSLKSGGDARIEMVIIKQVLGYKIRVNKDNNTYR